MEKAECQWPCYQLPSFLRFSNVLCLQLNGLNNLIIISIIHSTIEYSVCNVLYIESCIRLPGFIFLFEELADLL